MLKVVFLLVSLVLGFVVLNGFVGSDFSGVTCIIIVVVPALVYFSLRVGAYLDNRCLLASLHKKAVVYVSHRGRSDIIDNKLSAGKLVPYGPLAEGCFQKLLGGRILSIIDGREPAIWVSLGTPSDSKDWQLGSISARRWNKAITLPVTPDKLYAPKGCIKMLFGRHQLILKEEVILSGDEDVYVRSSSSWRLI